MELFLWNEGECAEWDCKANFPNKFLFSLRMKKIQFEGTG